MKVKIKTKHCCKYKRNPSVNIEITKCASRSRLVLKRNRHIHTRPLDQ